MACYRGWVVGWIGGKGVEVKVGLNDPLGLFGLASSPRSASQSSKYG